MQLNERYFLRCRPSLMVPLLRRKTLKLHQSSSQQRLAASAHHKLFADADADALSSLFELPGATTPAGPSVASRRSSITTVPADTGNRLAFGLRFGWWVDYTLNCIIPMERS